MVGSSLNHFPKEALASSADAWACRDAGVSEIRFANELLLLAAAAALHALESAGLTPADENELAQGFYDWMHQLDWPPAPLSSLILSGPLKPTWQLWQTKLWSPHRQAGRSSWSSSSSTVF